MEENFAFNLISSLLDDHEWSNVCLVSNDETKIRAHKAMLAKSSPYMAQLCLQNSDEIPVDTSAKTIRIVLRFIYRGCCDISELTEDEVISLYLFCREINVNPLLQIVRLKFEEIDVRLDNISRMFGVGVDDENSLVVEKCYSFIDNNVQAILENVDEFKKFSYELVKEIVVRDTFVADELDIFKAVKHWVEHNAIDEEKRNNLFECLRLNLIGTADFVVHILEKKLGNWNWGDFYWDCVGTQKFKERKREDVANSESGNEAIAKNCNSDKNSSEKGGSLNETDSDSLHCDENVTSSTVGTVIECSSVNADMAQRMHSSFEIINVNETRKEIAELETLVSPIPMSNASEKLFKSIEVQTEDDVLFSSISTPHFEYECRPSISTYERSDSFSSLVDAQRYEFADLGDNSESINDQFDVCRRSDEVYSMNENDFIHFENILISLTRDDNSLEYSLQLFSELSSQLNKNRKSLIGTMGAIELTLHLIDSLSNSEFSDCGSQCLTLAFKSLYNILEGCPDNICRFLLIAGVDIILSSSKKHCSEKEVLQFCSLIVAEIASQKLIRNTLMNQKYIDVIEDFLLNNDFDIAFEAVFAICCLAEEGNCFWDTFELQTKREHLLAVVSSVVSQWKSTVKENALKHHSMNTVMKFLSANEDKELVYFAVWIISNLTRTVPDIFCPAFVDDNGLETLNRVKKGCDLSSNVKNLISLTVYKIVKWQKAQKRYQSWLFA